MIHSNNTKSAASRRLPRPAQMLLGILTLSACLAPAPAATQEDDPKDNSAAPENSTPAKPEMSLSDIRRQLIRYGRTMSNEGDQLEEHIKLVEDGLETVKDFPVIAEVLSLCEGGPSALPRAKYVRSLIVEPWGRMSMHRGQMATLPCFKLFSAGMLSACSC